MTRRMLKYAGLVAIGGVVLQLESCIPLVGELILSNLGQILIQQGLAGLAGTT